MEKTLFSTPELAEWLGVFHTTVRRWIERGRIKGIRVGRNYKIPADEVVRILDGYGIPLPEPVRKYKTKQRKESRQFVPDSDVGGSVLRKLLVVEEIDDPAFVCRNGAVLGANTAFAELVGFNQADLVGADLSEVMPETFCGPVMEFARESAEKPGEGPSTYEVPLKSGNNGTKKIRITAGSLAEFTDVFLLVVKEVTEAHS
jgi:excisionase family DNA binding protein/PAS domain S-box-containing protein